MTKKLTEEEVRQAYAKKGYELISKYKGCGKKLFVKDKEGYICSSTWNHFNKGLNPTKFYSSNPYTIQNIKLWMETNAVGYELLSEEYINNSRGLFFKCPESHEFEMNWDCFHRGIRCPYCSNKKLLKGYNDIATTDPWMIDLGMSRKDAENYTNTSGKKVIVICPHCGARKTILISNLYKRKSISCNCSDKMSYAEKFIISVLNQLNTKYIREYSPKWSIDKKYDFYLENYNCIIECHGGQHYNNHGFNTCGGRTLKEEQDNDKYKKELALKNGITNYIVLDCRISTLKQIKNSILNSKLNDMFDLSNIDWFKCEEFALSNKVKQICDYWREHNEINNEGLTTTDIGKIFNLDKSTIARYLKKGKILGWCNYDSKEESLKIGIKVGVLSGKPVEVFKNGNSLGVFPSCAELERQSEKLFGVKLLNSSISQVCNGKKQQYKGFTFKYIKEMI